MDSTETLDPIKGVSVGRMRKTISLLRNKIVVRDLVASLPPAITVLAATAAAVTSGQMRAYASLIAIGSTFISVFIFGRRRRSAVAQFSIAGANLSRQAALAGDIESLVAFVGVIATTEDPDRRTAEIAKLASLVLMSAQSGCGKSVNSDPNVRSVLYLFKADSVLHRYDHEGVQGNDPPRQRFSEQTPMEKRVVEFALGDQVILVPDLHATPDLAEPGRSYRSFIAVPVRAGTTAYGLLAVDSDLPSSLTEIDKQQMIRLADVLAIGLAQIGDAGLRLLGHTETMNLPSPRQGDTYADKMEPTND